MTGEDDHELDGLLDDEEETLPSSEIEHEDDQPPLGIHGAGLWPETPDWPDEAA